MQVINWVWSIQLALTLDLVSVTNRRLSAASLATPAERPTRREGVGTGDRVHMASSVHTGAAAFLESRHPIVENGDYYSQLSQIRGYFHDENSEEYSPVRSKSRDDTKGARKQSSFGEPLSRVPSVSIFRSLPHFTATDLPEDHLSGQEKPPLPRGGASIGAFQSGMPFSSLRASPESRPMPSAAIPVGGASVEGMTSPSSSLGRSSAIPIAGGQSMAVPTKIAGSFREDDLKNSPMAMQFSSDARSPVNPIGWSPAKAADMSPPMSPFRSRGNSDEGMFMMDDDAGGAPGGRKRFESRSSVSPEFGRVHWSSGSCNEQGRYKYQEDRVVHYSNVLDEYTRRESDGSVGVFEPLPLCPGSLQSSTFSNSTLGFFGVFDGHAGHEGSTYVSQNLHLNIIKFVALISL